MNKKIRDISLAFAAVGAIGFGVYKGSGALGEHVFPVERGEAHLKKQGYTDISGGRDLKMFNAFNLCSEQSWSREYTATKNGKTQDVAVCHDLLFKTYTAPFSF